jgi:hypothetical protein
MEALRQAAEHLRQRAEGQQYPTADTLDRLTAEMGQMTQKLEQMQQWLIIIGHRLNTLENELPRR